MLPVPLHQIPSGDDPVWPFDAHSFHIPSVWGQFLVLERPDTPWTNPFYAVAPDGLEFGVRCSRCHEGGAVLARPSRVVAGRYEWEQFMARALAVIELEIPRLLDRHVDCPARDIILPGQAKADLVSLRKVAEANLGKRYSPVGRFYYALEGNRRLSFLKGPELGHAPRGERWRVGVPSMARLRQLARESGRPLRFVGSVAEVWASRHLPPGSDSALASLPSGPDGRQEGIVVHADYPGGSYAALYPIIRRSKVPGKGPGRLAEPEFFTDWETTAFGHPFPVERLVRF